MGPDDILTFVKRQPFQPFRLTLTDGRTYDIRHPEFAMVGRSSVVIGISLQDESESIYDRLVMVALSHIMQAELLDAATKI